MNWRRESKYNVVSDKGYRVCFVRSGEFREYEAWTPPPRDIIGGYPTPKEAKAACEAHAKPVLKAEAYRAVLERIIANVVRRHVAVDVAAASWEEDASRGFDATAYIGPVKFAIRLRRLRYLETYPYDVTIRSHTRHGARTEIDKITDGCGDYFLYCFAGQEEGALEAWRVIDLAAFRAHLPRGNVTPRLMDNNDGTRFYAFDVRQFQGAPMVEVESHGVPEIKQRELF